MPAAAAAVAIRSGQHAADELVRELRRRDVEHAREQSFARERFQRASAGTGRVEDEHLVAGLLEHLARALDAGRRHAEHARRYERAIVPVLGHLAGLHHPRHRLRGAREHGAADAIEAEDVDHRVQHQDVLRADEVTDRARGERAHHQLRHAERQRAHRRRSDRRARGAADSDHAGDAALAMAAQRDDRRAFRSARDGLAAIAARAHRRERRARGLEDLLARDVGSPAARRTSRSRSRAPPPSARSSSQRNAASVPSYERGEDADRHECVVLLGPAASGTSRSSNGNGNSREGRCSRPRIASICATISGAARHVLRLALARLRS